MTEPATGSDAANIAMTARADGDGYLLDGEKTYISNGGIADVYTVLARTGEAEGARGLSMFIVRADDPGLSVAERIEVVAPHPLARLKFDGVRGELIGASGDGFRIAMQVLTLFRVTVGAAALGFARRALDEAIAFATTRKLGAATLADNAVTQANLADMATAIDASALLIARAAWQQDTSPPTTAAPPPWPSSTPPKPRRSVIDQAVQLHGGMGVTKGAMVESLYREIRALRIYEGASEVQRQIIARDLLKANVDEDPPPPRLAAPQGLFERHQRARAAPSTPPAWSAGTSRNASSPTRCPASSRRSCATSSPSSPWTAPAPNTSSA